MRVFNIDNMMILIEFVFLNFLFRFWLVCANHMRMLALKKAARAIKRLDAQSHSESSQLRCMKT